MIDELSYREKVEAFCVRNRDKVTLNGFELIWCVQPLIFSLLNKDLYKKSEAKNFIKLAEKYFVLAFQVLCSILFFAACLIRKRRPVLLFSQGMNFGERGKDMQLGPLADEIYRRKIPCVEILFYPYELYSLKGLFYKRKLFFFYLVCATLSRLTGFIGARNQEMRTALENDGLLNEEDVKRVKTAMITLKREAVFLASILRMIKPRYAFLTDECGSGRALALALKLSGVPVYGIQHGASLGQYNLEYMGYGFSGENPPVVDALFVWGAYFKNKLLENSHIFRAKHVIVGGQLRQDYLSVSRAVKENMPHHPVRVLFFSQYLDLIREKAIPFLRELGKSTGFILAVKKHPLEHSLSVYKECGIKFLEWNEGLYEGLEWADVAVSVSSTALLEATLFRKPAVVFITDLGDRLDMVKDGLAIPVGSPENIMNVLTEAVHGNKHSPIPEIWERRTSVASYYLDVAETLYSERA